MKRAAILVVAGATCLYALYAFVYTPHRCDRLLADLLARTRLAATSGSSFDATVIARRNLAQLQSAERPCRCRVLLYVLEAENEDVLGRKEAAIESLQQALRIEPRPEVFMAIGTLLVELGRMDEAVDHLVQAIRFSRERVQHIASPEARRRVEERLQQIAAQRRE